MANENWQVCSNCKKQNIRRYWQMKNGGAFYCSAKCLLEVEATEWFVPGGAR